MVVTVKMDTKRSILRRSRLKVVKNFLTRCLKGNPSTPDSATPNPACDGVGSFAGTRRASLWKPFEARNITLLPVNEESQRQPNHGRGPFPAELLLLILQHHIPQDQVIPAIKRESPQPAAEARSKLLNFNKVWQTFLSIRLVNTQWYEIASQLFYESNIFQFGNSPFGFPLVNNIPSFKNTLALIPKYQLAYIRKVRLVLSWERDPSFIARFTRNKYVLDTNDVEYLMRKLVTHFQGIREVEISCSSRPIGTNWFPENQKTWTAPVKFLLTHHDNIESVIWVLDKAWPRFQTVRLEVEQESIERTLHEIQERCRKGRITRDGLIGCHLRY